MKNANVTIINILAVSFERVSGKYWAHHAEGRFTITESEYKEMKAVIKTTGKFEIVKRGGVAYDARELAEILAVVL